jgi:hypothetical protein
MMYPGKTDHDVIPGGRMHPEHPGRKSRHQRDTARPDARTPGLSRTGTKSQPPGKHRQWRMTLFPPSIKIIEQRSDCRRSLRHPGSASLARVTGPIAAAAEARTGGRDLPAGHGRENATSCQRASRPDPRIAADTTPNRTGRTPAPPIPQVTAPPRRHTIESCQRSGSSPAGSAAPLRMSVQQPAVIEHRKRRRSSTGKASPACVQTKAMSNAPSDPAGA